MEQIEFEPLPPFADPRQALRLALPSLRPAQQRSVTESAEAFMKVNVGGSWQPFRRDVTPYMVEPTDMISSRDYRGLVFCGPSQSGKTQMLQSAIAHSIMTDSARVALFQMTRESAAEFERNKLSPMLRNSPDLLDRRATGRGSDNQYQKIFIGGTQLTLDWPTITKLSSATIRLLLMTDYDHFPESIDGEGDAYTLGRARARTFMSRGMVVCESSPGAPIIDETWRAKSAHDAPPVRYGVLALYPAGTRGRWYWCCPHCDEEFEPTFKKLHYPKSDDPAEAGEAAEMRCPHNGCLIGHHLKREMNENGRWLHESQDGKPVPLSDSYLRRTDLLSYWLDGAAAAFSSWAELVTQYEQALVRFNATGDEEALKTAMNTGQAQPHVPRSASAENEISMQGLKDKSQGCATPKGIAPSWARYITVSIDTQGSRFDVGVTAWGERGQHAPIDRFDLHVPPETAPNWQDRVLRPFDVAEDWAVLEPLSRSVYPIEGKTYGLTPSALAVDMHGGGATTENAYRFYRGRRKAGDGFIWFLTRGSGGKHTDRIWLKAPERVSGTNSKRRAATDIKILNMATDRLKDAVSTSLRLDDLGQNYCFIPEWMEETHLIEFTAERATDKGWVKRPGMVRNESLDLMVQARALHIVLGGEKINWSQPPDWAVGGEQNRYAVHLTSEIEQSREAPERKARVRRTGRMRV